MEGGSCKYQLQRYSRMILNMYTSFDVTIQDIILTRWGSKIIRVPEDLQEPSGKLLGPSGTMGNFITTIHNLHTMFWGYQRLWTMSLGPPKTSTQSPGTIRNYGRCSQGIRDYGGCSCNDLGPLRNLIGLLETSAQCSRTILAICATSGTFCDFRG